MEVRKRDRSGVVISLCFVSSLARYEEPAGIAIKLVFWKAIGSTTVSLGIIHHHGQLLRMKNLSPSKSTGLLSSNPGSHGKKC